MRWLLVALPLFVFTSCSSGPCSAGNCSGCCDQNDQCVTGNQQSACGFSGATCSECNPAQFCAAGACFTRTVRTDGGDEDDAGVADAGSHDAGTPTDAGSEDAGMLTDAGSEDAGTLTDAGSEDAGALNDAGSEDAGMFNDAGSEDAGTVITHYPDGGSTSLFWDGGTCALKTDCPCFSSDDCAPDFHCVSEDSTGQNIYCLPGPRGPGAPGDVCTSEADCFSALCIDSDIAGTKCSGLCSAPGECPLSLPHCLEIPFGPTAAICAP